MISWEGFSDPDNAALFRTEETGDEGQYLAGDPSWIDYSSDIIQNLELNLEVVNVNGDDYEGNLIAAVAEAYANEAPLLFYFWTPHWLFAKYDLQQVTLPPYSDECYAMASDGGVDCAWPEDQLLKVFWSGLRDYAPDAHTFLSNFNYTNLDQIAMMASVQLEEKSPQEAAREWVDNNEDTWRQWLPED